MDITVDSATVVVNYHVSKIVFWNGIMYIFYNSSALVVVLRYISHNIPTDQFILVECK